jgi:hypothetical protein
MKKTQHLPVARTGRAAPARPRPQRIPTGATASVLNLQRLAGNSATQALLARESPAPQRHPLAWHSHLAARPLIQREDGDETAAERADQTANIATLNRVKNNANRRFELTNEYASKSAAVATAMKNKLVPISDNYAEAYGRVRAVLDEAEQEARDEQFWTGVVVGIAVGIAAGLIAAWAAPASAAAAWTITTGEAATAALSALGQGAGAALVTSTLAPVLEVEGQEIDSAGLDPSIIRLDMWQKISNMFESGHSYNDISLDLHRMTVAVADLVGELRVYNTGGESDLDESTIDRVVAQLDGHDATLEAIETALSGQIAHLDRIQEVVDAVDPESYTVDDMEKDIWTLWMSELALDSNILDIDAIEDHLAGLGMVDFGDYTSDEDEDAAIRAARREAAALQGRYDELFDPELVAELMEQAEAEDGPVCIDPSMAPGAGYDPALMGDNPVCYDPDMGAEGGLRPLTEDEEAPYCELPPEQTTAAPEEEYEVYGPPMDYGYSEMPPEPAAEEEPYSYDSGATYIEEEEPAY